MQILSRLGNQDAVNRKRDKYSNTKVMVILLHIVLRYSNVCSSNIYFIRAITFDANDVEVKMDLAEPFTLRIGRFKNI